MNRNWFSRIAYLTLTIAALAFASGTAWAQHGGGGGGHGGGGGGHGGGGGGHGGGGHGGGGGAHFSSGGGGGHWSGGGSQFSGSRGFAGSPATRSWSGGNWNRGGFNNWGGYGYRHGFYGGFYGGLPWYWGWGGYYPYYGGYYPYYDSYPYYSDSAYNYTPDYGYADPSYASAPLSSTPLGEANTTTSQAPPSQPTIDDNAVLIGVRVPDNAEIWIDGDKTSQTGTFREFVTPALEPGQKFSYDIKARWMENGKEVVRDRKLSFYAGDRLMVNLMAPPKASPKQVQSAPKP